jgi:hypothetical protein
LVVGLIAGVVGYILGCTHSEREKYSEVWAEQNDQVAQVVRKTQSNTENASKWSE